MMWDLLLQGVLGLIGLVAAWLVWFCWPYFEAWRTGAWHFVQSHPGPKGVPVLGVMLEVESKMGQPKMYLWHMEQAAKYGNVYTWWFLTTPMVTINHPDDIRFILTYKSTIKSHAYHPVRWMVGKNNLVSESGPIWHKSRKALNPAFHSDALRHVQPIILSQTAILCEKLRGFAQKKQEIDLQDAIYRLMWDTIGLHSFGHSYHAQTTENCQAIQDMRTLEDQIAVLFMNPLYFLMPSHVIANRAKDRIRKVVLDEYQARYVKGQKTDFQPDLLDLLFHSGLNASDITDNMQTLLLAGSDTTTALLTSAFYFLSTNPDIKERLMNEINTVVGPDPTQPPEHDHLYPKNLPLLDAILHETLRLRPPIVGVGRCVPVQLDEPVRLPSSGDIIPAGLNIDLNFYGYHQNKRYWGENASEWVPDRWFDDATLEARRGSFTPFALGPRSCLGKYLALQQAKIVIIQVLRQFDLTLGHGVKLDEPSHPGISLTYEDGAWFRVTLRE